MTKRSSLFAACFVEHDPCLALGRRAAAKAVGTFLLVLIVVGAGLAAQGPWHGDPLISLLASALAPAGAFTALIIAPGAVSGGHFNPLMTVMQDAQMAGIKRSLRSPCWRDDADFIRLGCNKSPCLARRHGVEAKAAAAVHGMGEVLAALAHEACLP